MLGKTTGVVHDLMVAIKDYGHYVQPMLANANGWKIGDFYLEMPGETVYTAQDISDVLSASAKYAVVRDTRTSGIESVGLALYLNVKSSFSGNVAAYLPDSSENLAVKLSAKQYLVTLHYIPAHQLDKTYNITVTAGESFPIKVSALSYVHTMLSKEGTGSDIQNAVTALFKYYEAAMAYKAASSQ